MYNLCLFFSRCGRKRKLYEPVWADLEDFQSLEISSLMWEDHYPDFVLDALNQCLPSKEQEEIVLNAPPQPSPKTLEVPISELRQNNHIHRELNHKQTNARSSGSLREGNCACLLSFSVEFCDSPMSCLKGLCQSKIM